MTDDLPEGWAICAVEDILESAQSGFASGAKDVKDGIAHLRMNNIGVNGELVLNLIRRVPKGLLRPRYELLSGDVLVCTTNSAKLVGKSAYFDLKGVYCFSNHLTRLRLNRLLADGHFLHRSLWVSWKSGAFEDKCKHWVNQSTLPKEALLQTEVLLAPLVEQRRIVAKLEILLRKTDECQKRLATVAAVLERFRQSVLAAACSGRLTADWRQQNTTDSTRRRSVAEPNGLPSRWETAYVGDVIEGLKYGTSHKCSYDRQGVPVLRISNVAKGVIDHSDLKYAELPIGEQKQLYLLPGDILIVRSNGSVSLVGKCALATEKERGFAYAGYLIRIRPRRTLVLPEFLSLALGSYDVRMQIEPEARSTSGVNNINSEEVRALTIARPPLEEQAEIVRRVNSLLVFAKRIETRYNAAQHSVDRLSQSLLAKAFRGELVPTEAEIAEREGRPYESAEQLLQRICHTRETTPPSARKKRVAGVN